MYSLKTMRISLKLLIALFSFLTGLSLAPAVSASNSCAQVFIYDPVAIPIYGKNKFREQKNVELAFKIMVDGSLNVSRTKVTGRRFITPMSIKSNQISGLAEANFKEAARLVVENFDRLEINLETAVILNKILTKGLVTENIRGTYDHRKNGTFLHEIDSFIGTNPHDFYVKWLSSQEAKYLFESSPIEFAETIHNSVVSLDSFPDGNGRLSRLLADLALIKSGLSPAYYTSMKDYFERGNARSQVNRTERKKYFREIVKRGSSYFQ